jgi:hypothetical protein
MNFKLKTWASGPFAALAVALVVAGCGGGGSGSSNTVTPTSSVYSGPITGFGSVIVNGVRFDTVGATTVDDDGVEVRLEDLRIGMMVTVGGNADDSTGRGTATRLSLTHGTKGPITNTPVAAGGDPTAGTFELVGQPVQTDASTVYVGLANGFADLDRGSVIEVHGVLQSNGTLLATVIENKTGFAGVRLVGLINNLDATTFKVGSVTVSYAAVSPAPTGLGNGKRVKIKTTAIPDDGDLLTLTSVSEVQVKSGPADGEPVDANTYLKLKGIVESLPVNGLLTVSGTPVDVSSATGKSIISTVGQFIEVKGIWDGSVLKASKVEAEDEGPDRNELYGAVSAVDVGAGTVVVQGVTVAVSGVTPPVSLSVGDYVEIKGYVANGVLVATKVEIKTGTDAADDDFEYHGTIEAFVSTADFTVNGVKVNADGINVTVENGPLDVQAIGRYVEIKGALVNGILIATEVEFKDRDD